MALASFLIDAHNWPANPYPFKLTNLLLHLINGALLAWLLLILGRQCDFEESHARWAAIFGAGLWLLHPLFVSTTLYIVQREAMLPATFVLLGLTGYIRGRDRLLDGHVKRGATIAAISIGLATVLAVLSKANGALLPLLAFTLEATVLKKPSAHAKWALNWLRGVVLVLPTCMLLGYLVHVTPWDLGTIPTERPWSYGQRLLTEPRVLLDYLRLLWLPHPYTSGLFNDQIAASTDIFHPWTTLPALLAVILLPLAALAWRRRFPLIAAAILFYFAGQLLESSVIALELYYEHRNYLPALLMFWPLAALFVAPGKRLRPRVIAVIAVVLMLAGMTHLRSTVWGNGTEQALLWAALNPNSDRAAADASQFEMHLGRAAEAEQRLRRIIPEHPDDPQLTMNLVSARCMQGSIDATDLALAAHSLQTTRKGTGLLFKWFRKAVNLAKSGSCAGFNFHSLRTLIDAAWKNPGIASVAGHRQDLFNIQGRLALAQGDVPMALYDFNAALHAEVRPEAALEQAAILGSAGFPCAGLAHLELFSSLRGKRARPRFGMARIHEWLLQRQGYWPHEIDHIRAQLLHDAKQKMPQGCPAELGSRDVKTLQ
ncbi:MAG TPA: tetratricopeptide repeat protein [Gammaproteobacteria bacterium]|nr:tetratricopeptide repeat protein [Gammaproteobacteria bacterium]